MTTAQAIEAYSKLPLRFESNRGQSDARVKFIARGAGYTLLLTPTESVLWLRGPRAGANAARARSGQGGNSGPAPASFAAVRMRLAGANPRPRLTGLSRLPGTNNYLIGRDSRAWHTGVPSYASALARDVYPGVDLLYHGRQGRLEYDFRVAPRADPGRIALAFSGTRRLSLDPRGDLVLATAAGLLRQHKPVIYQQLGGRRQSVSGRFVLLARHHVGFRLGSYDHTRALVIDPMLVYSTFLGGASGGNEVDVVATDSSGAAYVAGGTFAIDLPTTNGALQTSKKQGIAHTDDAFVTKLNPAGNALVYSTYLGGNNYDRALAIAVDSSGQAYLTGDTQSADFPTTTGAFQATQPAPGDQAFVSVLNAAGSQLVYSTYLGGTPNSSTNVGTLGAGIALDVTGYAYVTGTTAASDFPTKAPPPAIPFQTALGDGSSVGAGPGVGDAFVAELNPRAASAASSLVYSTYLGGKGSDAGNAIAVDGSGNAYIGGTTSSANFPTSKHPYQSTTGGIAAGNSAGFVTELSLRASGQSALAYSTFLGGTAKRASTNDAISAIAIDTAGHAYVTGFTTSTDLPTKNAFQPRHAGNPGVDGNTDAFVTKLDPGAPGASSLVYSSYLGGGGNDAGNAIAVTAAGSAYVAGSTDTPTTPAFPTVDPVATAATGGDAFVSAVTPDGSALSFSSYLGGGGEDQAGGVALDPAGNVYVAGTAVSTDFPTTSDAYQPQNLDRGDSDFRETFLVKLAPVDPAAPLVTGLARRSGPAGTSVVLTGHGFAGASAVHFGSLAASSFTVNSDAQVTTSAPLGAAGPVAVTVTTPLGTSPPNPISTFTYAVGTWNLTGSLGVALSGETAALLSDGKVLVAGGVNGAFSSTASAELYDPASGTWSATGSMVSARSNHTATVLANGEVLVVGGIDEKGSVVGFAELYDPASGTWRATGSMATARSGHTATLLANGEVLVAGGTGSSNSVLASAELYDPATGQWSLAGSLADARRQDTATLLSNGKVLVVGGIGSSGLLSSAELYDPAGNSWSTTGPLLAPRADHTATRLPDGRVLVAGGDQGLTASLASAEVYDPATAEFSPTAAMAQSRAGAAAAALPDGRVLVSGGVEGNGSAHDTAELYDPTASQWSSAGVMNSYRRLVFALALATGEVLVGGDTPTTELYNAAGPGSPAPLPLTIPPSTAVPVSVSPPSISGSAEQGKKLIEAHGSYTYSPTSFAYQWQRCDSGGDECGAVSGATGQTYTPTGADVAHAIRVLETAGNAAGTGGAVSSKETALVSSDHAPRLTHYRITNSIFVAGGAPTPRIASANGHRPKHKRGTAFKFSLAEPATVKIIITRGVSGARRGHRCLGPSPMLRKAEHCTRMITAATLTRAGHLGANTVAFSGRIAGRGRFKPGPYQATITATNPAGRTSKAQTITFVVVRR